jgi:trans-aconitate methyltransferase
MASQEAHDMALQPPPEAQQPAHCPAPEPYRHRREAESFGADPERYDRTRRAYPQALVQRIVAASPGRHVLDVGCGTGTEARQFQNATGCTVLGVDSDARMAEFARAAGVEVEVAAFEAWDPASRTLAVSARSRSEAMPGGWEKLLLSLLTQ